MAHEFTWAYTISRGRAILRVGVQYTRCSAWAPKYRDGHPKFRGCPQDFVCIYGRPKLCGSVWMLVVACGYVWVPGFVWTCGQFVDGHNHTYVVAQIVCLGAQNRGASWVCTCAHIGRAFRLVRGRPDRVGMDTQKWVRPHSRLHAQSRGSAHFDASVSTKLFTRQLRFTHEVFQNFLYLKT